MGALEDFLDGIPNKSLCSWFFTMFVLAVVGSIYQFLYLIFAARIIKNKIYSFTLVLTAAIVMTIGCFQALFLYSLCDRSIVKSQ
jgi:hypothetical protein